MSLAAQLTSNLQFQTVDAVPTDAPADAPRRTGWVYALVFQGILMYIGSCTSDLTQRMRWYISNLRTDHTTSPLHRFAQENGGFTDGWSIQPLKCVTFVATEQLREQEQASLDFWRAHVPGLLNRNDCVDQNARRRERARAWRVANGQGARDPVTGRSTSYHAQYCAAWRQRRREAQAQAQAVGA